MEKQQELEQILREIKALKNSLIKSQMFEQGAYCRNIESKLQRMLTFQAPKYKVEEESNEGSRTIEVENEDIRGEGFKFTEYKPELQTIQVPVGSYIIPPGKSLEHAVKILTDNLKVDDRKAGGAWDAYKCNIAMAFFDEAVKEYGDQVFPSRLSLAQVSNKAADRFLCWWTGLPVEDPTFTKLKEKEITVNAGCWYLNKEEMIAGIEKQLSDFLDEK